jgi:cell wall-associated NlpC family hydrolase
MRGALAIVASDHTKAGSQAQFHRPHIIAGRGATSRRITATVCLAVAASFVVPATAAHADPEAEARKKLTKLNEQVDQQVEKYNQVREQWKVAKKKYKATQEAGKDELATYNELQAKVSQMAADAYKAGDTGGAAGFAAGDPQAVLDQAAVFAHLTRNRTSELSQFLGSAQRLRREQAQAKAAYDEVDKKAKEIKARKAELDKQVAKQKRLVARYDPTPSSGGIGGTYTGPASGSARAALDFAFAQKGKPYSYGATGPGSYDCSGLTMKAWAAAGVNITRTTNSQYAATKRVAKSDLQPGDLVFFSGLGHVGLYIGGGQMIHAPSSGKTVTVVSINSSYYSANYYGAGRP